MNSLRYAAVPLFALIFVSVATISFLSPPTGDTWGYIVGAKNRTPIDMLNSYYSGYMGGNPRLGQYFLMISGYGRWTTALVNTASLLLLIMGGLSLVLGRFFNPLNWKDAALGIVFFAVLAKAGQNIGQMLFYVPFTANYVFGFGLLIFFVALVRLGANHGNFPYTIAVFLLGFLAGLTNEHTVPAFLLAGLLVFLMRAIGLLKLPMRPVYYVAYFALLLGYLALYFAPGQNKRYGEKVQKNSGIENLLTDFPAQMEKVASLLLANAAPFYVLAFVLLAIAGWQSRTKQGNYKNLFWISLLLFVSIVMAFTTAASPLIGQRLMFSSYAALAFSLSGLFLFIVPKWMTDIVVAVATITSALWLGSGLKIYSDLNQAFRTHETELALARTNSIADPSFHIYFPDDEFRKNHEYLRREYFPTDPDHRLNRMRARIYRLPSVRYLPTQN